MSLNFHHISPLSTMISIRIQSKNNVCSLSLSKYPLLLSKLGGWVKEDVGCKTGTLHCCCRVDATADSRSRLLRLQNKPNILPFVCKKCSSCQKTCISATVRLHPYVTLGYDCLLDPSWDCLIAPKQSASTSISVAEKLLCFELYYGTTGLKIYFYFLLFVC